MGERENEIKKESANLKIFNSLKETLEGSSIHSFPNIIRNKYKSIKLVWFILFLVSTGGFAYTCYKSVTNYLNFDVVTKIEIKSLNIADFPMIRICDLNILASSFSKVKANEILSTHGQSLNEFENPTFSQSSLKNQSDFFIKYRFNRYLVSSNIMSMNDTIKKKVGKSLNEFLITCVYGLHQCNIDEFGYYFNFLYGNCFLFNSGTDANSKSIQIKKSTQAGSINGLNLEFFIGAEEENNMPFSSFNGLSIFVSNQDSMNPLIDGINISPGYNTNIIIQRTKIIKQPSPYSECTADLTSPDSYKSDIYKRLMNVTTNYNFQSCQQMCYQKHVGIKCKCQDPSAPSFYPNLQLCIENEFFWCNTFAFQNFLSSNSFSNCDCPIECETIVYSYSTSTSKFPTMSYAKSLLKNPEVLEKFNKTNVTYDDLRKNLASVNIFYNEISEQIVSQEPKMDLFDLISNIGGIIGLFLGMSLLSFVEFIEIIMQSLFIWLDFNTESSRLKPLNSVNH